MKKIVFVLILLAFLTPVFAQQNNEEGEGRMYYINVPIERIYPVGLGYLIQYRTASVVLAYVGIPVEWFWESGGHAEIIRLPPGRDWPTMSVFYRDGEFSHVRIYTHRSKGHWTWGNIPQGTDVSRFFTDRESFRLQF